MRSPVVAEEAVAYGLFSWRQAREAGYRTAAIELRIRRGEWLRRGRGVLVAADHIEQPEDRLLLAVLQCGPTAVASHLSAAEVLRWELLDPPERPQVIVPRNNGNSAAGGVAVRRQDLGSSDVTTVGVLPLTTPTRTAVDVASTEDGLAATVAIDSALRLQQLTLGALRAELRGRRHLPGHRRARRVAELSDPTSGSVPETVARLLFRRGGLTMPCTQFEIDIGGGRIARVDFAWPERRLVVEIDGFVWHWTSEAVGRDQWRQRRLTLAGWTVLRFTADDVRQSPDDLVAEVREALGE